MVDAYPTCWAERRAEAWRRRGIRYSKNMVAFSFGVVSSLKRLINGSKCCGRSSRGRHSLDRAVHDVQVGERKDPCFRYDLALQKEGVRLRKLSSVFQSRVTMLYDTGLVPWRRCPELERDWRSGAASRLFFDARHP